LAAKLRFFFQIIKKNGKKLAGKQKYVYLCTQHSIKQESDEELHV